MLDIERMLTLSTAHIPESLATRLDDVCLDEECRCHRLRGKRTGGGENSATGELSEIAIYPKGEYGWFICITDELAAICNDYHGDNPELFRLLKYAREKGCNWLCLDRDGETVSDLPVYDW